MVQQTLVQASEWEVGGGGSVNRGRLGPWTYNDQAPGHAGHKFLYLCPGPVIEFLPDFSEIGEEFIGFQDLFSNG